MFAYSLASGWLIDWLTDDEPHSSRGKDENTLNRPLRWTKCVFVTLSLQELAAGRCVDWRKSIIDEPSDDGHVYKWPKRDFNRLRLHISWWYSLFRQNLLIFIIYLSHQPSVWVWDSVWLSIGVDKPTYYNEIVVIYWILLHY